MERPVLQAVEGGGVRILALSDTQIGSGRHLTDNRLSEQTQMLDRVYELVVENDVDVVLHLGDVFEHRHPSEEERLMLKKWAQDVAHISDRLVVLQGNHDARGAADAVALDLYDDVELIRDPQVVELGGASLACLPWAPLSHLKAAGVTDNAERTAEDLLVAIAEQLRAECDPARPAILAAHWWLSGASSATGFSGVISEPVLPLDRLEAQGWSRILGGHVHMAQTLSPWSQVLGTPWVNNFGEEGSSHGVWLVDTCLRVEDQMTFLPLTDRAFVTVDLDLKYENEIPDFLNVGDAVVRLRIRCTEEQQRRFDVAATRWSLAKAGAHRVFVIFDVAKQTQQRVVGLDESVAPQDAVGMWCGANDVPEGLAAGLVRLAGGYLDTAKDSQR
jgi:exonuclease SbcD